MRCSIGRAKPNTQVHMPHATGRETLLLTQSVGIQTLVTESTATFGKVTSVPLEDGAQAISRSSNSWAIVVDLAPDGLADAFAIVRAIRSRRPRAVILGVATLANDLESLLRVTATIGFSDVVLVDVGEVETLVRAHLRDESKQGAYAAAIRCVCRAMPPQQHELARVAIEEASVCTSVERFGAFVGSSRWRLDRKLGRFGITASEFVDCCRVVLGGALLEYSHWPIDRVAEEVGYGDVRAFRGATTKLVGCRPSELKAAGATERIGRAVASRLIACAAHPRVVKDRPLPWQLRGE